jgi:phosphoribosylformylglycinamidine synthase
MGQLVGCIRSIAEACRALDMPIVSGNVSLYNETDGRAILPTPTIGAVGLLASLDQVIRMAPCPDQALVLLGETRGHLAQSAYAWELFGKAEGPPPPVDLAAERAAGELVRALHAEGLITAAHDLSDGGLAIAAAEMALAADTGVALDADEMLLPAAWFFGEDQARYLVATGEPDELLAHARAAGVPARAVGRTGTRTGGGTVRLGAAAIPLADLRAAHEGGFERLMGERPQDGPDVAGPTG